MSRILTVTALFVAASALKNEITVGAGASKNPSFFGFNNGEQETTHISLSDPKFIAALSTLSLGTYRYPAGTAANYWDWKNGCEFGDTKHCGQFNNKLQDLQTMVSATGVTPIFVVNMLTASLAASLAWLAAASALGLPITHVEMGNEFFNNHADFEKAFPTGKDYGAVATTWIAAIAAVYPNATFAAVGAPAVVGNNARKDAWNKQMFQSLVGASAVTMHEYHDAEIGTTNKFTPADAELMLGAPFYWWPMIDTAIKALPAGIDVWMTEYNLKDDTAFGISGTWAHGLYIATETLLALGTPALKLVDLHCAIGYTDTGALFSDTAAFAFGNLSPDQTLVTKQFGRSAVGWTMSLFANSSLGMNKQAPLTFSPNPPMKSSNGPYPSLTGVAFSGRGSQISALIVNLGPAAYDLPSQATTGYNSYLMVSGNPTDPVNKDEVLTIKSATVGGKLTLPPYSVTHLQS